MQSLGRGLRKAADKKHLVVWDISDNINKSTSNPNYTYGHFIERLRLYASEKHEYKIIEVDIEK